MERSMSRHDINGVEAHAILVDSGCDFDVRSRIRHTMELNFRRSGYLACFLRGVMVGTNECNFDVSRMLLPLRDHYMAIPIESHPAQTCSFENSQPNESRMRHCCDIVRVLFQIRILKYKINLT